MLTDPAYLSNPYAELKRLRELGPVHLEPGSGVYFVLGHHEFRNMAIAPEMGRDTQLWTNGWNRPETRQNDPLTYELFSEFQPQMTNANPPDHRRMKSVYEKAFRPDDLKSLLPMIEAECRRLLDYLPLDTSVDFMEVAARPLAQSVSRFGYNIPSEMDDQIAQWVAALAPIANIFMTPEQKQEAQTALREFKAYLRERFETGADKTEDGFFGLGAAAFADGTMNEEESLNNLVTLIAGGTATASLLGNGLLTLLRHPDQFEKLRADRALIKPAIEEMLRFEPGCSFILRVAISDYQCGTALIPAGSLAIGLMGATNRDPAGFTDPDVFDISRRPNPHTVFGVGAHICIGKALVRMTTQAALSALMDRFQRIELAGEPVWWTHRSDQHGLHSLPLRLG